MKISLLVLPLGLFFAGCASVSITGKREAVAPREKPAVIFVQNFLTGDGDWKITSRSKTAEQFKQDTADILAINLVNEIRKYIGPAERARSGRVPANAWLLSGRFIRVSEGSPGLRIIIGVGAGGTKMETETAVSVGSGAPFLRFATTGGSNAMPGLLVSTGPGNSVLNAVSQGTMSVHADAKRTARMITASIAENMVERGWLKNATLKSKKPGEYKLLQSDVLQSTPSKKP